MKSVPWERAVAGLVLAVAGGVALHAALRSLGPDSAILVPYNSDAGMAVLQANDRPWTWFHAFAFGQDRFGAWPFFLVHLFVRDCTPAVLSAIATLFVFSGVVPAMLLARSRGALGGLAWLVAVLWPDTAIWVFSIAQPYAWQLVTLLWAWWMLRRTAERGRPLDCALAAALCFLAVWMSRVSGPMLLGVAAVEAVAARASTRRAALLALPALLGIGGDAALRAAYRRYSLRRFHRQWITDVSIDWGFLGSHFRAVSARLLEWDLLVPLLLLVAAAVVLAIRSPREEGDQTVPGALVLAMVPLPVLLAVAHVRENGFADRYFTPVLLFARFG
ncbi:MAG: hypothetical protein ACXWLM_04185, partial [Myxococcales bacterium]